MAEKRSFSVHLDEDLCKGSDCYICVNACPKDVFAPGDKITPKGLRPSQINNQEQCTGCRICEALCPDLAVTISELPEPGETARVSARNTAPTAPSGGWTTVRSTLRPGTHYMMGDEACAEGALAAGCAFYAGYPITPASEIMVHMSIRLPETDGVFVQMEDEIGSMASIIGASWAGIKSMTATAVTFSPIETFRVPTFLGASNSLDTRLGILSSPSTFSATTKGNLSTTRFLLLRSV